jgi:hypothetical protein
LARSYIEHISKNIVNPVVIAKHHSIVNNIVSSNPISILYCVILSINLCFPGIENMSSVLGGGFGYNIGGNQARADIRTLQTRVDALTKTVDGLKGLLLTLNPDKSEAINAYFSDTDATTTPPPPPPVPAPRPVNPAVNRVRP